MDSLFLRQVWAGNDAHAAGSRARGASTGRAAPAIATRGRRAAALLPDQQGPVVAARSQPGRSSPARRPSRKRRNFYPAGADKAEVQRWLDSLSGEAKAQRDRLLHRPSAATPATASFTAVPYSVEYQGELARAAALLREAAAADRRSRR